LGNSIELAVNTEPVNIRGKRATLVNEKYGDHPLNTFDIWLAESNTPTPLVIYIHGGGFIKGDKSKYYSSEDLVRFLDAGVSVATINYRFMTDAPYGIKASFNDSKRCLQYIRYNADRYNIDKLRIACSGGSAGAGTSLWLAFHDDMADEQNPDPVLRESTRLTCAGAFATQSTYDIFKWEEVIGVPMADKPEQKRAIATAFGLRYVNGTDLRALETIRKELDFLSEMDRNDPPIFVSNYHQNGVPANEDELNHHPLHAKAIKEKAEEVGLKAVVYAPALGIVDDSGKDLVSFFLEYLFPQR
jgi:carboxylesterase type B